MLKIGTHANIIDTIPFKRAIQIVQMRDAFRDIFELFEAFNSIKRQGWLVIMVM